jgi:hypothetical protein
MLKGNPNTNILTSFTPEKEKISQDKTAQIEQNYVYCLSINKLANIQLLNTAINLGCFRDANAHFVPLKKHMQIIKKIML